MCGGGILKGLLTKEFEARGRRGLDNNLCRCFHCDYSQLGVLPPAATCLTSRQLGQHLSTVVSLSPLYHPPQPPSSSYQTCIQPANWRLAYQTGPIPVNCASESISFLERKIKTRMLSHYSTIQLSVRKDVRTSCADKKVNSLRFWEDQPLFIVPPQYLSNYLPYSGIINTKMQKHG